MSVSKRAKTGDSEEQDVPDDIGQPGCSTVAHQSASKASPRGRKLGRGRKRKQQPQSNRERVPRPKAENARSNGPVVLNDDVIFQILASMDEETLLKSGEVSEHWQGLAMTTWTGKTQLSFASYSKNGVFTLETLKWVLSLCGSTLTFLDVSAVADRLTTAAIFTIASFCPELEELNISGVLSNDASTVALANGCVNLKKVVFGLKKIITEKGYSKLVTGCQNMEYLDISHSIGVEGRCFTSVGPNMRVLHLDSCERIGRPGFKEIALNCPRLVELHANFCTGLTDRKLRMLSVNCTQLSILDIGGRRMRVTSQGLLHIRNMCNLEELYMSINPAVDDDVLVDISSACKQLRVLDISACHSELVTDRGVAALANLSKLSSLNISYLHHWSILSVFEIADVCPLVELTAVCVLIADVGFQTVITQCKRLKWLDVSGCPRVTKEVVKTAVDVVGQRDDGLKLELFVGETHVVEDEVKELTHDLLEVDFQTEGHYNKDLHPGDAKEFDFWGLHGNDNREDASSTEDERDEFRVMPTLLIDSDTNDEGETFVDEATLDSSDSAS